MIQRSWKECDLSQAFFKISTEPVVWVDRFHQKHFISGQKAIVDVAGNRAISVVSSQYKLVLNKDAYNWADFVIRRVFPGKNLNDFVCYNVYMPKTKGSCRIDLIIPQNFLNPFGNKQENWTPFIRISNSYNKTIVLKYEIGFCRWICLNGVIFDQKGITISISHTGDVSFYEIERQIEKQKNILDIDSLWEEFRRKMQILKNTGIPMSMALPMYCKAFKISIKKDEITNAQKETFGNRAQQIVNAAKEYFAEMGNNAYAMFNVMTDFASFPSGTSNTATYIHGYQRKVGNWVDEFVLEAQKPDFSLYEYLGKETTDSAFYLESLIQHN